MTLNMLFGEDERKPLYCVANKSKKELRKPDTIKKRRIILDGCWAGRSRRSVAGILG
ncbi:MAG: hypothetical protein LBD58_09780 [Treponema sp.]|nr:hypothetical protein [Treponema sp.]